MAPGVRPTLMQEIERAQRLVKTDAYQMSIGEIVSMYESNEITIAPEFQRLFRWEIGQKSKLIESLLLGIPIPSIFVFETENGTWELIDGLQRVSTILEFMGILREGGKPKAPSILEATKYLPSLHNAVWQKNSNIEVDTADQYPIDKSLQLAIRRSRIAVEILKRPSDDQTKFDLFQRLNAGGTLANAQELRNCVILMINGAYFRMLKAAAERPEFKEVISLSEDQQEKQRHLELAMRFLAHVLVPYDGRLDVEEFIDESAVQLASKGAASSDADLIEKTFDLLHSVEGANSLRRFDANQHTGRVGLVGLECIAVGVGKNLKKILDLGEKAARAFVKTKARNFWQQPEIESFISPGLRGTVRIQRTVPFGERWFRP